MTGSVDATTIYLVRHGTHDRVDRVLCGRMPGVSLGARGREQAEQLAAGFSDLPVAAVSTSPRERARETAAPIAARLGLPLQVDERLDEIDFGAWTGRSFEELDADPDWRAWNGARASAGTAGGETMRDAQDRVVGAVESFRRDRPGQAVVAVGHGDVLKAALCWWLGLSLDRILSFDVLPGSVSGLSVWEGGGRVLFLNRTSPGLAA